jgi:hypothetical protein
VVAVSLVPSWYPGTAGLGENLTAPSDLRQWNTLQNDPHSVCSLERVPEREKETQTVYTTIYLNFNKHKGQTFHIKTLFKIPHI